MLNKQRHIYQELAKNVLNEDFYKSSDVHYEKKKFSSFTNEAKNKEIFALRVKIKDSNENNKNEINEGLVQRARQRMMRKNINLAKAQRRTVAQSQVISNKFATQKQNNNNNNNTNSNNNNTNNKGNLGTNKVKENSNSPNASNEKILDLDMSLNVPQNIHPNKDCNFYI
jgi:hypothetical protein